MIARLVGASAEQFVMNRRQDESALEILDRLCNPWRGCDAEWEAEDPQRPGYTHPQFTAYTDPHPKAALGMLMLEAFAPNGIADLPRYQYLISKSRASEEPYDAERDRVATDAWWSEVYEKFKYRYEFW